jgi:3',5'-cyclic AMP phosphodiesterase CpdA
MNGSPQNSRKKRLVLVLACIVAAAVAIAVWAKAAHYSWVARPWDRNFSGQITDRVKLREPGRLTLAVMGDCRDNWVVIDRILAEARDQADAAVVIGDLISGASRPGFIFFLRDSRHFAGAMPVYTGIGNHDLSHDHDGDLYREYFGPDHWWWRWHDVTFVMINNVERTVYEDQLAWLGQALRDHAGAGHVFLMMHIPPYLNDEEGMNERRTRQLEDVIAPYRERLTIIASDIHTHRELDYHGIPLYITGEAGAPQKVSPPVYGWLLFECGRDDCQITRVNMGFIPHDTRIPGPALAAYWFYGLPALALASLIGAAVTIVRKPR